MRLPQQKASAMPGPFSSNSAKVSAALEHVGRIVSTCRGHAEDIVRMAAATPVRSIGIIGAGIMGAAIAREHAVRGIPVVLLDTNEDSLRRAARSATRIDPALIRYTSSNSDLVGCDLVLESIAENRTAKQSLYRQLAPQLANARVLATNTSTIPIARLASGFAAPARFGGMHFCHPVRLRPLVEIIPGTETSADTVATIAAHTLALGRLPLIVADGPGFVVNRLLMAYLNEALDLLVAGVAPGRIDAAMLDFGMPMGPLRQLDEIGLDTALQSGIVLSEVTEHRSRGTELLVALVKSKQLGVKAGAGVYCYPSGDATPSVEAFSQTADSRSGEQIMPVIAEPIGSRLLAAMTAEAHRLLQEGKAADWQIDVATIFGLGFPCWRGGLLWWSNGAFKG